MSSKTDAGKQINAAKAQEQFDDLKELLLLENTRVLHRGVMDLYNNYVALQKEESVELQDFVNIEYANCVSEENVVNSQNVYCDFFSFLDVFKMGSLIQKTDDTKTEGAAVSKCDEKDATRGFVTQKLAEYLQYCIDVMNARKQKKISVIYSYERIANDICKLMNYDYCYFVYADNNGEKIIRNSDFYVSDSYEQKNISSLIYSAVKKHKYPARAMNDNDAPDEQSRYKISRNTLCTFYAKDGTEAESNGKEILVSICIDLYNSTYDRKMNKSLYIVLAKNHILKQKSYDTLINPLSYPKNSFLFKNCALVLSFRNELKEVFDRDMAELLSMNYNNSYDDVDRLNDSGLKILHISDMHIENTIKEKLLKVIKDSDLGEKEKYDLMIISGDVVQAKKSAKEMEDNYDAAIDIIYEIAKKLWTEENKKLRNDWRKRIIIIPGNHDYAIMNELSAVQTNRALKYGYASDREGSIMVKFAYYIDFIRKLFGIQLSHYIENNLNDFRYYKNLFLSVCCLNSCLKENPVRTNKVNLDSEWISFVIAHNSTQYNSICTVHHAPSYQMNYFLDKYDDIQWENMDVKLIEKMENEICPDKKKEKAERSDKETEEAERSDKETEEAECSDEKTEEAERSNKRISEEEKEKLKSISQTMYNQYEEYIRSHKDKSLEKPARWKSDIRIDMDMSEIDKKEFEEQFEKLQDHFQFITTLSGHEHTFKKKDNVFIQTKFFETKYKPETKDVEVLNIHYGILELQQEEIMNGITKYRKGTYTEREPGKKDEKYILSM